MNAYLNGLPEPLYALFGTGYLGYTAARQWGRSRASKSRIAPAIAVYPGVFAAATASEVAQSIERPG